jgi:mRNA interferase RelE/StbE
VGRTVSLDEKAIDQATAFLVDDPEGLRDVLSAIDRLAQNPHPAEAFPFGSTGLLRLRVGRYRVLYTVTDDLISVVHIARRGINRGAS